MSFEALTTFIFSKFEQMIEFYYFNAKYVSEEEVNSY